MKTLVFTILLMINASLFGMEVRTGVMAQAIPGLWSGQSKQLTVAYNIETVFDTSITILEGEIRPNIGGSVSYDFCKIYGGVVWEWEIKRFFVNIGVGISLHDGFTTGKTVDDQNALGSVWNFRIPIEVGYRITDKISTSILFEHISNAYSNNNNEGMDSLGVRVGFQF
jgi:lipid A 3-O-deacylase